MTGGSRTVELDEHHAPGDRDEAEKLRRVYRLSDGTFRLVVKAIDPKTGKPKFKERFTREVDPQMTQNAAIAYRAELINEMAGRSGTHVAARGHDKHLHYSRGVTVEEMRQASMALMQLVPTEPSEVQKVGTSVGTGAVGTGTRMRNGQQRPRVSRRPA